MQQVASPPHNSHTAHKPHELSSTDGEGLSPASLPQFLLPGILPPAARRARLDRGQAAAKAREFTRQVLRSWGLAVLADDATLIVSELVTNGMRHGVTQGDAAEPGAPQPGTAPPGAAQPGVELVLCRRAGVVACAVIDPGAQAPPQVQPADPDAEGGRGLHVIEALSAAWGWTRLRGREKAVWATLRVPHTDAVGPGIALPAAPRPGWG